MTPTRLTRMARSALLVLAIAMQAPAAPPRVLSIIPRDGPLAVVAVDNLERSDARLRALLKESGIAGYGGLEPIFDAMGIRAGIDLTGSAAVVLLPAAGDDQSPASVLILLPVSNPDAFFRAVQARDDGGLKAFDYAGATYCARAVPPSYIVLGESRAAAESFIPATNHGADKLLAAFGGVGARLIETADLIALTDVTNTGPLLQRLISLRGGEELDHKELKEAARGGAQPEPVGFLDASFVGRLMQLLRSESRGVLLAASFEPDALRIEAASTFVADGVLVRAAQSPREVGVPATSPLATMPSEPYLLALGLDAAHPGVRVLADELGPPGRSTKIAVQAELMVLSSIPSMEALSAVVYEPASIMFGSMARMLISWRAPVPEEGVRAFRGWVESLSQRPFGNTVIAAEYRSGEAGDTWTITPPPGAAPMLPMLLGPVATVQGTVLTQPGRAYLTWSNDAKLIESAGRMGDVGAASLDREEMLARVSAMLPAPRIMEAYADGSSAVRQFAPMLAGAHAAATLPKQLPPIGAAVTVDGGVACLTAIAPAEVLNALSVLSASDPDEAPEKQPERPRRGLRRGPPRETR